MRGARGGRGPRWWPGSRRGCPVLPQLCKARGGVLQSCRGLCSRVWSSPGHGGSRALGGRARAGDPRSIPAPRARRERPSGAGRPRDWAGAAIPVEQESLSLRLRAGKAQSGASPCQGPGLGGAWFVLVLGRAGLTLSRARGKQNSWAPTSSCIFVLLSRPPIILCQTSTIGPLLHLGP